MNNLHECYLTEQRDPGHRVVTEVVHDLDRYGGIALVLKEARQNHSYGEHLKPSELCCWNPITGEISRLTADVFELLDIYKHDPEPRSHPHYRGQPASA